MQTTTTTTYTSWSSSDKKLDPEEEEAKTKVKSHSDRIDELRNNLKAVDDTKLHYASLHGVTLEKKFGDCNFNSMAIELFVCSLCWWFLGALWVLGSSELEPMQWSGRRCTTPTDTCSVPRQIEMNRSPETIHLQCSGGAPAPPDFPFTL